MSFTKVFISVFFLLLSASLFAAKPEKILICHVGNEVGPNDEVYDPSCAPIEENNYFCADAGKIDLIEVAKAGKHLGKHGYGGITDYEPASIGATGEGAEDTDGDGVDEGCDPPLILACPCWAGETLDAMARVMNLAPKPYPVCYDDHIGTYRYGSMDEGYREYLIEAYDDGSGGFCQFRVPEARWEFETLDAPGARECHDEFEMIRPLVDFC